MNTDKRIALVVIVAYVILTVALLPAEHYYRALGGAAFVFAVIMAIGTTVGPGPINGVSVIGVAFGSGAILVFPTFPAMGGTTPRAIALGFLGVQAAVLLWIAQRWRPRPPKLGLTSLRQAWRNGLIAAATLSAIAAIPATLLALVGESKQRRILLVIPAYFVGALAAATAYWLLQRISHLAAGRYLIGVLGGTCMYGAIAPVVLMVRGKALDPTMLVVIALVCGSLAGPAFTLDPGSVNTDDEAPGA